MCDRAGLKQTLPVRQPGYKIIRLVQCSGGFRVRQNPLSHLLDPNGATDVSGCFISIAPFLQSWPPSMAIGLSSNMLPSGAGGA